MHFSDLHHSKTIRGLLLGLGLAALALVIFKLGQISGYQQARFATNLGDNFNRNFNGPGHDRPWAGFGKPLPGGHGAVGKIVGVKLPRLTITDPSNVEKIILVSSSTEIRRFRNTVEPESVGVGEHAVVLGTPNETGEIEAKLIRLLPPPPSSVSF